MLTPTKISLRNYCQHIKLDVDLSDSLHMVIGANGRGKSNLLHAINFALTGESTPGAKRLQDDILDGAESATVSLDFTGNDSVKGNITREIRRNGADSAKLTLDGREPTEGANKCRELLEELVGNDLKTVIRTVIVGQHEIREMLFSSSPTKRLEEIQKLLLGDIFTRATESISNERARLYIDENIEAKTRLDKKELKELEKLAKQFAAELSTCNKTLESSKLSALKEKAQRVARRNTLLDEWMALKKSASETALKLVSLKAAYNALTPAKNIQELAERVTKWNLLKQAWKSYEDYCTATGNMATALLKMTEEKQKGEKKVAESKVAAQTLQELTLAAEYYNDVERLAKLGEDTTRVGKRLKLARERSEELKRANQSYLSTYADIRGKANVLKVFLAEGSTETCPICGTRLTPDRVTELATNAESLAISSEQFETELKKSERALSEFLAEIAKQETELDALNKTTKELTSKIGTAEPPKYPKACLAEKIAENKQKAASLAQESEALAQVVGRMEEIKHRYEQLKENPISKPQENFSAEACALDEKALAQAQAGNAERSKLIATIGTMEGSLNEINKRVSALEKLAQDEKLPHLSEEITYGLSTEETAYLEKSKQMEDAKAQIETKLNTTQALIKTLTQRIETAESAITGAKATKEYALYLSALGKVIKSLPKVLLQRQLAELCKSMQEIISSFHFYQPFGVMVDEKLEIKLKYPNKVVRPIKKASGGEQIILSIAFRLAAHRKFSTLDWIAIDEPTNHLTDDNIKVLRQVIEHLRNNLDMYGIHKLIIATHSSILANSDAHIINI